MLATSSGIYSQLHPRNGCRRERKPGARERNSGVRQRFQNTWHPPKHAVAITPRSKSTETSNPYQPSYAMNTAVSDFRQRGNHGAADSPVEEERIISKVQDLSTLEAIRKSMERTSKVEPDVTQRVPKWMVGLDINLDISAHDIIPQYDTAELDNVSDGGHSQRNKSAKSDTANLRLSETFSEKASFVYMDDDEDGDIDAIPDSELDEAYEQTFLQSETSGKLGSNQARQGKFEEGLQSSTHRKFDSSNQGYFGEGLHTSTHRKLGSANQRHVEEGLISTTNRTSGSINQTNLDEQFETQKKLGITSRSNFEAIEPTSESLYSRKLGSTNQDNLEIEVERAVNKHYEDKLGKIEALAANRLVNGAASGQGLRSNTFKIAEGFSPTANSPRRYQGDKKVMSMQQGGIRSTPFQPKSKKFINQMITFNHMKHHDRKLKVAKPAIDTQMPSTFKIALDRKRLVEHRLSDSWSREDMTSPTNKSLNKSTTSISSNNRSIDQTKSR